MKVISKRQNSRLILGLLCIFLAAMSIFTYFPDDIHWYPVRPSWPYAALFLATGIWAITKEVSVVYLYALICLLLLDSCYPLHLIFVPYTPAIFLAANLIKKKATPLSFQRKNIYLKIFVYILILGSLLMCAAAIDMALTPRKEPAPEFMEEPDPEFDDMEISEPLTWDDILVGIGLRFAILSFLMYFITPFLAAIYLRWRHTRESFEIALMSLVPFFLAPSLLIILDGLSRW